MFTKEEKKQLKLDFWEGVNTQLSAKGKSLGRNIDWMNYPTNIKRLFFRMEVNHQSAKLCIDLQFIDEGVREVFFEQFEEFQNILNNTITTQVHFVKDFPHANGKTISRIYIENSGGNIFNPKTWPEMTDFLVTHFIELDEFWQEFGEVFYNLK